MKKIIFFLAFLASAVISNAQWVEQTSGSTHWFNSLCFTDQNTGWVCGTNGTDNMLVHTTDGGTTWVPQAVPVTTFIGEVTFLNSTFGWAVGNGGVLLKSTDGGTTWTPVTIATTKALQSVWFTDNNNGWIVGESGLIFHSTDGGTTWTAQASGVTNRLIRVRFLNSQVGWIAGWGGTILYTANAGTTWVKQTSPTTFDLISISIVDANNIWMSGNVPGKLDKNPQFDNGTIVHTSNSGTTWQSQYTSTDLLNSVCFANLNKGWCFGSNGLVMHTEDGGTTWVQQSTGITTQLVAAQFANISQGWAAGENGEILYTNNGGFPVGINDQNNAGSSMMLTNEPNPFSSFTKITYFIKETSEVEIMISDPFGKRIASLVNQGITAGSHSIEWNASGLSKGVYFCTLKAEGKTLTQKMIVR